MINVNFFKKEKRNILPYIVLGVFLILVSSVILFFFISRNHYNNTITEQTDWMNDHTEEVAMSRQLSQLDQQTTQSLTVQENLLESRFPMHALVEDIISFIPTETTRVNSFQLSEASSQVSLILENTDTTEARNIVQDLEMQPYIERVQLLRAIEEGEEASDIRYEMIINLNVENLQMEEEAAE